MNNILMIRIAFSFYFLLLSSCDNNEQKAFVVRVNSNTVTLRTIRGDEFIVSNDNNLKPNDMVSYKDTILGKRIIKN